MNLYLIAADHLEEQGRHADAETLRECVAAVERLDIPEKLLDFALDVSGSPYLFRDDVFTALHRHARKLCPEIVPEEMT